MSRAPGIVILVAGALAVVLAGVGLYANGQPAEPTYSHTECTEAEHRVLDEGRARVARGTFDLPPEFHRVLESGGTRRYDDARRRRDRIRSARAASPAPQPPSCSERPPRGHPCAG